MRGRKKSGLCIFFLRFSVAAAIMAKVVLLIFISGCGDIEEEGREAVYFAVCDETGIPDELMEIINEKKSKPFRLSYANNSYFYIAVGYGRVEQDALKIIVNDLYRTSTALYVDTTLVTEKATSNDADRDGQESLSGGIYPYIVIRCERYDLPVIFDTD